MSRVSVVIPVFNSAALIGNALRSVFAQTFRDFEVIVIDDGSEDREELDQALANWNGRLTCIHQRNGGPASARNTGIRHATGELIAFLDADDEWLPSKLSRQVAYFDRYPDTGLLHTGVVGEPRGDAPAGVTAPRHVFCELFHTAFFVNTLTVMVPRRVLDEVGWFDERREVHIEDWDLWLRIAARHPFGYLPEPLAYHRPGGIMSSQLDRTYAAQALVMTKNAALCALACARHRAAPDRCDRARRHVLHRDWGYDRLRAEDWRGAREHLRRALSYAPRDVRTRLLYLSTFLDERMRARARRLFSSVRRSRSGPALPAGPGVPSIRLPRAAPTLLHDTVYRRTRRRLVSALHDLDDGLSQMRATPRRVLFEAASPMSFAMYRPIYERLRRDPRLELWFTASTPTWSRDELFAGAGVAERFVDTDAARWLKVSAYINTDFWDMTWLRRRARRIHLFHGVAGKYGLDAPVDLAPVISGFDCLMFANADRRSRYIEAGLVADDQLQAALVGYPKVDCLVDGSLDRAATLRRLGLNPAEPVIIYAPTWSPYSSLNAIGETLVGRLAAEGLQILVKLHDRSYDRKARGSGGIDWGARLSGYETHPRVRIVREADGCPFLAAADLMVSDHSSIAFEYMLLDRPVVTIDCPELIEQARISAEKVRQLRSASRVTVEVRDTVRVVLEELERPGHLSAERRSVAGELFYRPGTATDRAVALIYTFLNLPVDAEARTEVEPGRAVAAVG